MEKYKNLWTFLIGVLLSVKKKKSVITFKFQTDTNCCFPYLYLHRLDLTPKSLLHFFTMTSNDVKITSATKAVETNAFFLDLRELLTLWVLWFTFELGYGPELYQTHNEGIFSLELRTSNFFPG